MLSHSQSWYFLQGIWHPMATSPGSVFETVEEYNEWYDKVHCPKAGINPKTAVTIGVILQKSHINTKDEAHYVALISELEARGARVICIYSGGLDFSGPVEEFFYGKDRKAVPDTVINLTGFALVGGPASQDHPKAVQTLQALNVPYICAVPLVFQVREDFTIPSLSPLLNFLPSNFHFCVLRSPLRSGRTLSLAFTLSKWLFKSPSQRLTALSSPSSMQDVKAPRVAQCPFLTESNLLPTVL
jgi:CobN/Magnesium Chelatase